MKAWQFEFEGDRTIIYAETRNQARVKALHCAIDESEQIRIIIGTYTVTDEQYEQIAEILEIKKPTAEELGICFE